MPSKTARLADLTSDLREFNRDSVTIDDVRVAVRTALEAQESGTKIERKETLSELKRIRSHITENFVGIGVLKDQYLEAFDAVVSESEKGLDISSVIIEDLDKVLAKITMPNVLDVQKLVVHEMFLDERFEGKEDQLESEQSEIKRHKKEVENSKELIKAVDNQTAEIKKLSPDEVKEKQERLRALEAQKEKRAAKAAAKASKRVGDSDLLDVIGVSTFVNSIVNTLQALTTIRVDSLLSSIKGGIPIVSALTIAFEAVSGALDAERILGVEEVDFTGRVSAAIGHVTKRILEMVGWVVNLFGVETILPENIDRDVAKWFDSVFRSIGGGIASIAISIKDWYKEFDFLEMAFGIGDSITAGFNKAGELIRSAIDTITYPQDVLLGWVGELFNKTLTFASDAIDNIDVKAFAAKMGDRIVDSVMGIIDDALSLIANISDQLILKIDESGMHDWMIPDFIEEEADKIRANRAKDLLSNTPSGDLIRESEMAAKEEAKRNTTIINQSTQNASTTNNVTQVAPEVCVRNPDKPLENSSRIDQFMRSGAMVMP